MSEPFLLVGGVPGLGGTLRVPGAGAWTLDTELDGAAIPTGAVEVKLAGATLKGTIEPVHSGAFGERRLARVVGGAGGWAKIVRLKHYRNDGPSGVARSVVLTDLAAAAGEQLELDPAADGRLGTDFVPLECPAGDLLRLAVGGTSWWVDFAGVTHVGTRAVVDAGEHEVLDFDPAAKVATVSVDELVAVGPGSRLRSVLFEAPFVVRDLEAEAAGGSFVLRCWGYYESAPSTVSVFERFVRVLRAFVAAFTRRFDFHGVYRYRVLSQAGDRVTLQPVRKKPLPEIRNVALVPGIPGLRMELKPGSLVLVAFVDGDPAQPVVTHFWRIGEPGWLPLTIQLDAEGDVKLAGADGRVIRDGEIVWLSDVPPPIGAPPPGPATIGSFSVTTPLFIRLSPALVEPGAPGLGYSRVLT